MSSDSKLISTDQAPPIPLPGFVDVSTDAPRTSQCRSTALDAYLITSLSSISLFNSFGLGVVTIALPQVVDDLKIPSGLALWPGTVNSLAIACCLLPAGAVADIIGRRRVSLAGILVLFAFTVACGVAQNSASFIVFRALAGVGAALVQATSIGILSHSIVKGQLRNVAFSCVGLSIPFGFAVGLILGGVFASTSVGWRLGFYLCAGLLGLLLLTNCLTLPNDDQRSPLLWRKVLVEVDWIGNFIVIVAFALLSYSFSFQEIQGLPPLEAALRYLPNLICGVILEIVIGIFIHRLPIVPVVILAGLISSVSPLLMALIDPAWSFWRAIFWAMLLAPVALDVLYTAAVLLITDIFPMEMHGIAGAAFNIVSQMGMAGGIAITALVASGVSLQEPGNVATAPSEMSTGGIFYSLEGLIAVFWNCLGLSIVTVILAPIGLRKRVYLGQKEATDCNSEDQHP